MTGVLANGDCPAGGCLLNYSSGGCFGFEPNSLLIDLSLNAEPIEPYTILDCIWIIAHFLRKRNPAIGRFAKK